MIDPNAWLVRRKIIIWSLIWLGSLVTAITLHSLYTGRESSLMETIIIAALTLFGSIVGSYVFGAIWDDKNKRSMPGTIETKSTITTVAAAPSSAVPMPVTVENVAPIEVQNVDPKPPEGFAG